MQAKAEARMGGFMEAGYSGIGAYGAAPLLQVGDILPATRFAEAATGIQGVSGETLCTGERLERLGEATVELGLWALGSKEVTSTLSKYKLVGSRKNHWLGIDQVGVPKRMANIAHVGYHPYMSGSRSVVHFKIAQRHFVPGIFR
jgi:hypothetical protein